MHILHVAESAMRDMSTQKGVINMITLRQERGLQFLSSALSRHAMIDPRDLLMEEA